MRRYTYTGKTEGVELRHKRVSYRANEDGIFEVPFEIERDDFEEIVPEKPTKEKSKS